MVGPASTFESLAIANGLTRQRHIVLFPQATGTSSDIRDGRTVLRPVPSAQSTGIAAARAAKILLHGAAGKTVSLAAFNEPYGTDLVNYFSKSLAGHGRQSDRAGDLRPEGDQPRLRGREDRQGQPRRVLDHRRPGHLRAPACRRCSGRASSSRPSCSCPTCSPSPSFRRTSRSRQSKVDTHSPFRSRRTRPRIAPTPSCERRSVAEHSSRSTR